MSCWGGECEKEEVDKGKNDRSDGEVKKYGKEDGELDVGDTDEGEAGK